MLTNTTYSLLPLLLLLQVFIQSKVVSIETILNAHIHTHTHTHTQRHTYIYIYIYEHTDDTKLNVHTKRAANRDLRQMKTIARTENMAGI